jgi:peptidyl-prolyl cis-trans isomerase A (cyclophilin A)
MEKPENPIVVIETSLGDIKLELYTKQAPITSQNFLSYIQDNAYENTSFYRVVRQDTMAANPTPSKVLIEVIQGGLGMAPDPKKRDPIALERTKDTGLNHLDGSISMGRLEPDSANAEFFICINDQPELDYGGARNPDGQGFAAFGQVLQGMDVVRKIHQCPAKGQALEPAIPIFTIRLKQ